jgi:serine/threonine protein kinase
MDAYVFTKEIARGGMCVVYEVDDGCVVKKIKYGDLFIPEIDILRRNRHPNISKLIRIEYDKEAVYLFLKRYPKTLREYLDETVVDDATWIRWAYQLASALEYLHKMGYYHCDIKENNVMIDEEGNAVLIDFSVSYSVYVPYNDNTCSSTPYQPPERLKQVVKSNFPSLYINYKNLNASPYITPRNDLWAYGCLLVYMKTRKYFFGTSATLLIQNSLSFLVRPSEYLEKKIGSTIFDSIFRQIFTPSPTKYTFTDILREDIFKEYSILSSEPCSQSTETNELPSLFVYPTTRWMLEIAHTYLCTNRTYVYATNLFMRTFPTVEMDKYQLLGAVSLFVYVIMFENGGECGYALETIQQVCVEQYTMDDIYEMVGKVLMNELVPIPGTDSTETYMKKVLGVETDDVFTCSYDDFCNLPIPSTTVTIPTIPNVVEGTIRSTFLEL